MMSTGARADMYVKKKKMWLVFFMEGCMKGNETKVENEAEWSELVWWLACLQITLFTCQSAKEYHKTRDEFFYS